MKLSSPQEYALRNMRERGPVVRKRGGWSYWRWLDPKQHYVPFTDSTIRAMVKKGALVITDEGPDEVARVAEAPKADRRELLMEKGEGDA